MIAKGDSGERKGEVSEEERVYEKGMKRRWRSEETKLGNLILSGKKGKSSRREERKRGERQGRKARSDRGRGRERKEGKKHNEKKNKQTKNGKREEGRGGEDEGKKGIR